MESIASAAWLWKFFFKLFTINKLMKMRRNRGLVICVLGVLLVIIVIGTLLLKDNKNGLNMSGGVFNNEQQVTSDNQPMPFEELTIPYLRTKMYESDLGELVLNSQETLYKSYLTSYQSDGLKINAQLTVPTGQSSVEGWPAIVFVHGYVAPTTYTTLGKYVAYVDYLASNGIVVLKIDLRGHGLSEGEAGGAYYSSDYVIDTLNAYSALSKFPGVNSKKIGLWGHSMAGNVVMRSIAVKTEIPVAVIWAGAGYTYTDLREYRLNDNSYRPPSTQSQRQQRRTELFNTYGEFDNQSDFWRTVAPTNYLSEIKTAIQLNHSIDDGVVGVEYSRNLNALLDKSNIRHELNEYQSGGHNINGSSFGEAMRNTLRFLTQY